MNRLTRILALITMLAGYQPSLYAQRQTQNSFRSHFGPNALVGYYAYVPADYATNSGKSYPILIYLHGSGDKAWNPSDLSKLPFVKRNGPPFLIEGGQDFPFIVISPQCPFPSWDNVTTDNFSTFQTKPGEFVDEILEKMKTIYRIDLNRIYITGISMGGASAWEYTQLYPQKIAASIPIAGWSTGSKVCNIAASKVAVWTFQGELDGGAGISGLVNKINSCVPAPSPLAKATVYKGVGNDAWTQTYNNSGPGIAPDNIYEWLLRQSKSLTVNKAPVVNAGADLSYTLSTNTLTGDSLRIIGSATDDLHVSSVLWTQISGPFVTLKNTNQQTLTLKGLKAGTYILRLTAKDDAGLTAFDEVNLIVNPAQVIIAKQIVDKSDWKLKAEKAIVIDHDTSLSKTLTTGVDYNLENTLPANSTETISVKLPVLTDASMFTFSFKGSIAGIQVNTYQSGDGVTWHPIQLGAYTNGRGDDLQKADIPLSVSNKWFRISFVNTTSTAATYREIGMFQFKTGVNNQYFLILGASISESAGGHTEWAKTIKSRVDTSLQPVVFNWSLSGERSAGIKARTDEFLAQHPRASCVLIEAGGNDVSAIRPLTFDKRAGTDVKTLESDIRYIIQAVKNANKLPLFSRLSFRNYYQKTSSLGFDQPPVNGGLNQENGSLPYNYTLDKIIKEMTPLFWDSLERRGYLDFYPFTLNNQSWLIDGDGVHFYGTTAFHIREFWADYAFKFLYTGQKAPVMIYKEIVPGLTLKADSAVLKAEHSLLEKDVWDARILVNQVSNRTNRLAFEDRLAKILIGVAPSITLQPFGKTIKEGNSVTFIITSSGTAPLSYQWKRNNVSIPGAIQASYTYTPVLADNGSVFICTVTNSFGSVISSSASLSVTPLLPVISQHPASISVLVGANTTFSVIASGSGLTYQWQKDGVNIASAFQSTYTLNGITQSMTGSNFRCLITNTTGTLISNNAVLTVTPAASVNGLTGRYYSNTYGGFSNTVAFTRIDPTVDFYWPLAPNAAVSADQFSVRWIGRIKPQYSQLYTFYTKSDDGVRLWINNQLVIDKWLYQNEKEYSGSISLVADKLYDIKIEYFDGNGGATCRLYWSGPSLIRQIVPTSALFPESNLRRGEFENESNEANIEVKNTGLIYPTYVEDFINIDNYEIGNLASICTIEGLVIKEVFIMLSHEKLNVADLKPGTYFVRQGGLTNLFIKKH